LEKTDNLSVTLKILNETVLDILESKRIIDNKQFNAGLRFRSDFYSADITSRVTGSYSGVRNNTDFHKTPEKSKIQERAYERWRAAVKDIGAAQSKVLISSVCYDAMPMPPELELLQDGLLRLAKIYKIH